MKYLKIQNDGLLDIRLVALMGGTTKSNDKYKIGQFGTGLKYTLAFLYRNNLDFKIFTGTEAINISLETEKIKDTDFEIICIDGKRSGMTTQMGRQWTAWMIIRELWCNALDEGGQLRDVVSDDKIVGEENKTTFYIQVNPQIQEVLDNWASYFIHHEDPMFEDDEYAIYLNDGPLKLYKKGVLIYHNPDTKSLFKYDIKGADINELREFRGSHSFEVFGALRNPNRETISYFLQHIKEEHYEGSELDYEWFKSFAEIWKDALGTNRIARRGDRDYYVDSGVEVDFSNVIELPKRVYKALVNTFQGIGALAMSDDKTEFYEIPNFHFNERIKACINILAASGYQLNSEAVIKVGMFREKNRKASAHRMKKQIMISEVVDKLTDEEICALLIENNEYISTGIDKEKPEFFRHFINLYARQLLATHEIEI